MLGQAYKNIEDFLMEKIPLLLHTQANGTCRIKIVSVHFVPLNLVWRDGERDLYNMIMFMQVLAQYPRT